jgi:hypothetical protein
MFSSSHITPVTSFAAVLRSNNSSHGRPQLLRPPPCTVQEMSALASVKRANNKHQVSQFGLLMQTVSERRVQCLNCTSADEDGGQWGRYRRRQDSGHSKILLKLTKQNCCWLWPRQMTDPSSSQRGRPTSIKPLLSDSNKNVFLGPRRALTPRLTGRLTVCRNMTLTFTLHELAEIRLLRLLVVR